MLWRKRRRVRSICWAAETSSNRLSSGMAPICIRYMRTGSSVASTVPSSPCSSGTSSSSSDSVKCDSSSTGTNESSASPPPRRSSLSSRLPPLRLVVLGAFGPCGKLLVMGRKTPAWVPTRGGVRRDGYPKARRVPGVLRFKTKVLNKLLANDLRLKRRETGGGWLVALPPQRCRASPNNRRGRLQEEKSCSPKVRAEFG